MLVLRYAYVLALIVWIGGLVTAGAFAAPSIFRVLEAQAGAAGRVLAGAAFGEVLRRVLVAGEVGGVVMLVALTILRLFGPKPLSYGVRAGILAAMLVVTAYTAHVVLPEADELRRRMDGPMASVAPDHPTRARFDHLHLIATRLVTGVAIAGIVIAAWEARE